MANLSAYLNFSIVLDNSVNPAKVRFVDNSSYPGGLPINGLVEITQPDGITATGAMIGTSGTLLPIEIEMRKDVRGQIQAGAWRIKYTVNSTGYDETILDRTLQVNYSEPVATLSPLLNIFLPQLRMQDGTNYVIEGLTLQNVTRSWQAVITGVATVTGGNVLQFDMIHSGNYYDAEYVVSMSNVANWTINGSLWASIRELVTVSGTYKIVPAPSLESLLNDLNEFKATLDATCGCKNNDDYSYAVSLFSHIKKRGCYGQTLGLDVYITELVRVLNGGVAPTHENTEAVLNSYSWSTPCSGSGTPDTMSNLGNGEGQVYESKVGTNFRMRSLKQGSGITITQNGSEITIAASNTGEANTASNVGDAGQNVFIDKVGVNLRFRRLSAGSGISMNLGPGGEIIVSNSSLGETNAGANVGTGAGIYKDKNGLNLRFKTLKPGSNVTISETADEITINAAASGGSGEANVGANLGAGAQIYIGKSGVNLNFRGIIGSSSTGIQVLQLPGPSNDIEISGPGAINIGTGDAEVFRDFNPGLRAFRFRKLKAGTNVGITYAGDDIVISATGGGGGGADVTAPFIIYAVLISSTVVRIIFSEPVNITNANGCSVSSPISNPITGVTGGGTNTLDFTVTNGIAYGAVVQFSYNSSLGNIRDLAVSPNVLATISNYIVYNTVPLPSLDAVPGVAISSPTVGEALIYNGTDFANASIPGGSGGGSEEGTF